jgi:hypothetical protein
MTNAIIDLSNMFFRSMFIVGGFGKKKFTFDSQEEMDKLMRKVAMDITSVIRQLNPSRVIFALDSKSWRKEISIDENEGYKAHRKKNEDINWENVYSIMNDFSKILDENGLLVSQIDRAEADDLMALWRNELLYNQKQHVILISADEDVRQLVDTVTEGDRRIYSIVYNPFTMGKSTKKLFVPSGFSQWINTEGDIGDIFNRSIDVDKEDLKRLIKEGVNVEEIDGQEIIMRKIFCGDDGDNVPAIYTWLNDKQKSTRITPAKYEKIRDYIGAKNYKDLFSKGQYIFDQLIEISGNRPAFKISDRLNRQAKLVVLDPEFFPGEIVEKFNKYIKEDYQGGAINSQSLNMLSLLQGTKYVDDNWSAKGKESPIFKQIDTISAKALF